MHDWLKKGIAGLLSVVLVLCSVVTGVVPVRAAEASADAGYEADYTLGQLTNLYTPESATVSGNKISWTNRYGNVFYKIPQDVVDAGLVGFRCTGTISAQAYLKIANADNIWSPAIAEKNSASLEDMTVRIDADQRETATAICIMSCEAENEPMEATIESVVFITETPVPGYSVPTDRKLNVLGSDGEKTEVAPYETTFKLTNKKTLSMQESLTSLKISYISENATASVSTGGAITFGFTVPANSYYEYVNYEIPQKVFDAGLIGYRCNLPGNAENDVAFLKLLADNGDVVIQQENVNEIGAHLLSSADDLAWANGQYGDLSPVSSLDKMHELSIFYLDNMHNKGPAALTVDSITFLTRKDINAKADAPSEGGDESGKPSDEKTYEAKDLSVISSDAEKLSRPVSISFTGAWDGLIYAVPEEILAARMTKWTCILQNDAQVASLCLKNSNDENEMRGIEGEVSYGGNDTLEVKKPDEIKYIHIASHSSPLEGGKENKLVVNGVTLMTEDGNSMFYGLAAGRDAAQDELPLVAIVDNKATVEKAGSLYVSMNKGQKLTLSIPADAKDAKLSGIQVVGLKNVETSFASGTADSFVIEATADTEGVIEKVVFVYKEKSGGGGYFVPSVSGGGSGGSSSGEPAATTTTTETKPDGTKVETTTTKTDSATTTTTTESRTDGTVVETTSTANADGSTSETVRETSANGASVENTVVRDVSGEVVRTTVTTTKANGSSTEKTVIAADANTGETTVTVKTNAQGKITSAKASLDSTASGNTASLSGESVGKIVAAAGTSDVSVSMTVRDASGNIKYTLEVCAADLQAGQELYAYKLNAAGEYVMVNAKSYPVDASGNVSVSISGKGNFGLVSSAAAKQINKTIKASIVPKNDAKTVKAGKSASFKLDNGANKKSIKSISYTSGKKSVATVDENGKISAKGKGTAAIKAKVTLKNGTSKTIKMKVTVK